MLYMLKSRGSHVFMSSSSFLTLKILSETKFARLDTFIRIWIRNLEVACVSFRWWLSVHLLTKKKKKNLCYHTLWFRCHKTYRMKLFHIFFSHFLENLPIFILVTNLNFSTMAIIYRFKRIFNLYITFESTKYKNIWLKL